ncbi:MAG: response regulator [Pseudomonadota bacterium]|jgi:signal transduction histidine kinase
MTDPSKNKPTVLVVDDDRFFLRQMVDILTEGGFRTEGAASGEEALELLHERKFQVIVTDVVMGTMSGIELLKQVRMQDRLTRVICVSSIRSFDNVVEMIRNGASNFLPKPFKPEQLLSAVSVAVIDNEIAQDKERIVARSDKWNRELLALRMLGEASSKEILQNLFKRTIEAISDTLQVETASLMVLEDDTLRLVEAMGLPREVIGKATVPVGKGISGHVARTGEPLLINDISKDDRFRPSTFKDQYSTQSALCVPLVRADRILGVLNANNKMSGESFTESDRDLLHTMAAQVAMSMDNARLFVDLEEKAEALKVAHEELVRLDKDKTELILNLSHELKTPLTSIIGFASLIPTLELSGETDSLAEFMGRLEKSASHLNYLVERILELFRLEAGRVPWKLEPNAAAGLIEGSVKELEEKAGGRKITFLLDQVSGIELICDMRLFKRCLELILENAFKFSPAGSPVEIKAVWHDALPYVPYYAVDRDTLGLADDMAGWIELTVRDHGKGMKEKDIPLIFEKFRQLGDILTEKPEGIGLGLSIARAIMERHHGAVWADLAEGGGTRLHLLFGGREREGGDA